MLIAQPIREEELPFGIVSRALNETELDAILGQLGKAVGPILSQHALVNVQTLIPSVDSERGVLDLFDALMSIAPQVVAFGCDEPEAEQYVRRLPVLLAVVLFLRIVEMTIEKWGIEALIWKIGVTAGQNSTLPEFLLPMVRNRIAALRKAAPHSSHPNKTRRRASGRRQRR